MGNLFEILTADKIKCRLCPHNCLISSGDVGQCKVRKNSGSKIELLTDSIFSAVATDQIEKKPLYHFLPGSEILSLGSFGCNLHCSFCQNYNISQTGIKPLCSQNLSVQDIVKLAKADSIPSIAYTYNEPIIQFETVTKIAKAAKENGIKNVAVTAGYIEALARGPFFENMDGVNVDLKSFKDSFYQKYSKAKIKPVLDTLEYLASKDDCWLEITTLLIPGLNDSDSEIRELCSYIKNSLGEEVPIHFSAFYPTHKLLDVNPTPVATVIRATEIAKDEGLIYSYGGNIRDKKSSTTFCPNCSQPVIERDGLNINSTSLVIKDSSAKCNKCGHSIPGTFS